MQSLMAIGCEMKKVLVLTTTPKTTTTTTRMVQLPATAAIEIEYVAAGHFFPRGSFGRGDFC